MTGDAPAGSIDCCVAGHTTVRLRFTIFLRFSAESRREMMGHCVPQWDDHNRSTYINGFCRVSSVNDGIQANPCAEFMTDKAYPTVDLHFLGVCPWFLRFSPASRNPLTALRYSRGPHRGAAPRGLQFIHAEVIASIGCWWRSRLPVRA